MDDLDFAAAMIPKKIGRPRKPINPPETSTTRYNISTLNNNNINDDSNPDIENNLNDLNKINIKDQLSAQELTFLEHLFNSPRNGWKGQLSIDKAMLAAGFGSYSQDYRYKLARKIVEKYERGAAGASQVFRDIGFGQIKVAQGIADKAENAQSEAVSLNALALAARCQGMTEPNEAGRSTGVQIIINTGPAQAQPPGPGAPPPALVVNADGSTAAAPPIPRKPLQITR